MIGKTKSDLFRAFLVAFALVPAITLWAGPQVESVEDVLEQIEAVKQRMEQVHTQVQESRNERAVEMLEKAARFLEDAERALDSRQDEIQARNFVRRALEMVNAAAREALKNRQMTQQQVERELIRLHETLRSCERIVQSVDRNSAENLTHRARVEAEKARMFFDEGAYHQALERIRLATQLCNHAKQAAAQSLSEASPVDASQNILQELDDLLQRARDNANSTSVDNNLNVMIQKAERFRDLAAQNFNNGRNDVALHMVNRAKEVLHLVLHNTGEVPSSLDPLDRALRELERVRHLIAEADQNISEDSASGSSSLQKAKDLLAQAEEEIENGHPERALQILVEAVNLASQLLGNHSTDADPNLPTVEETARREYHNLIDGTLPDALEHVRRNPNRNAVKYLEQAQIAAEKAEQFLSAEDYRMALQYADMAKSLAFRAIQESQQNINPPGPGNDEPAPGSLE